MVRAWQARESLSDLTLYADWDSFSSMILSLRIYGFEHGTIPVWNFMFCGGRPELAVPYSWAWTWPSLFAYLLEPNLAIVVAWVTLSVIGFAATRALLARWTGHAAGSAVGAAVYAFGGLFAARFNAGHLTFAFFHLVPLMMWVFERGFARALAGGPNTLSCAAAVAVSFLFTSAALPHALIYFYPAFALLVVVRVVAAWRRLGASATLRASALAVGANALGVGLAAYKLWPIIRWQLDSPRVGVRPEAYDVAQIIGNTLTFVPDYFEPGKAQPWHVFSSWEYNAYVGPLPWLLALCVFAIPMLRPMFDRASAKPDSGARSIEPSAWFAVGLVVLGIWFALGNDRAIAPGYLFGGLPLVEGIRGYARFQVLIVFGLAILTAHGIAAISSIARNPRVIPALCALVLAPVLVQAGALVWNIAAEPNREILALYGRADSETPLLVRTRTRRLQSSRHQTPLLAAGYWIANCRSDLALPGVAPLTRSQRTAPLTVPAPDRLADLTRSSVSLAYSPDPSGTVKLNLRTPFEFDTSVPVDASVNKLTFERSALAGEPFTLTARYAAATEGAIASGVAAVATLAFVAGLVWSDRQARINAAE